MTRPPDILAHLKRQETLSVGDRVMKTGGDYEAEGEVRAVLTKRDGKPRIVVEFDIPRGLLFVMRPNQVEKANTVNETAECQECQECRGNDSVRPWCELCQGKGKVTTLAETHWSYVRSVLLAHEEWPEVVEKCGFHYVSAFVHGFKHGVESTREERG